MHKLRIRKPKDISLMEKAYGLGKDYNFTPRIDESFFERKSPLAPVTNAMGRGIGKGLKYTFGTGVGRMAFGMAAGGIYGLATSEHNSQTAKMQDMAIGMGTGLAMGFGSNMALAGARYALNSPLKSTGDVLGTLKNIGGKGLTVGKKAANIASSVASFAMRNPATAMVGAAIGLGAMALASTGRGQSNADEATMNTLAIARGVSSTQSGGELSEFLNTSGSLDIAEYSTKAKFIRNNFMGSTDGLVQGLHRNRH